MADKITSENLNDFTPDVQSVAQFHMNRAQRLGSEVSLQKADNGALEVSYSKNGQAQPELNRQYDNKQLSQTAENIRFSLDNPELVSDFKEYQTAQHKKLGQTISISFSDDQPGFKMAFKEDGKTVGESNIGYDQVVKDGLKQKYIKAAGRARAEIEINEKENGSLSIKAYYRNGENERVRVPQLSAEFSADHITSLQDPNNALNDPKALREFQEFHKGVAKEKGLTATFQQTPDKLVVVSYKDENGKIKTEYQQKYEAKELRNPGQSFTNKTHPEIVKYHEEKAQEDGLTVSYKYEKGNTKVSYTDQNNKSVREFNYTPQSMDADNASLIGKESSNASLIRKESPAQRSEAFLEEKAKLEGQAARIEQTKDALKGYKAFNRLKTEGRPVDFASMSDQDVKLIYERTAANNAFNMLPDTHPNSVLNIGERRGNGDEKNLNVEKMRETLTEIFDDRMKKPDAKITFSPIDIETKKIDLMLGEAGRYDAELSNFDGDRMNKREAKAISKDEDEKLKESIKANKASLQSMDGKLVEKNKKLEGSRQELFSSLEGQQGRMDYLEKSGIASRLGVEKPGDEKAYINRIGEIDKSLMAEKIKLDENKAHMSAEEIDFSKRGIELLNKQKYVLSETIDDKKTGRFDDVRQEKGEGKSGKPKEVLHEKRKGEEYSTSVHQFARVSVEYEQMAKELGKEPVLTKLPEGREPKPVAAAKQPDKQSASQEVAANPNQPKGASQQPWKAAVRSTTSDAKKSPAAEIGNNRTQQSDSAKEQTNPLESKESKSKSSKVKEANKAIKSQIDKITDKLPNGLQNLSQEVKHQVDRIKRDMRKEKFSATDAHVKSNATEVKSTAKKSSASR
ncbi:MAG: hypothetical protein IPP74_04930 [Alphaproteobacteria bacterium]|nr:hypothetical protein [Alphaproteobacteria bacterium]